MANVKKNIKDINVYAWESTWFALKPLIISGIFFVPIALYFLIICCIIGFSTDKETLEYGIGSWLLVFLVLIVVARWFFFYKKNLKAFFRDANSDGDVELSISFDGNEYLFENLSNKSVGRLKKSEIKRVEDLKKCVFIKTTLGQVIFLPKTDEVLELFVNK